MHAISETGAARLVLRRPDDWHLHLRDADHLAAVVGASARQFARALVMPNLKPPVTTTDAALAYRERIRSALPPAARFEPLMTLYLTDDTPAEEITRAKASGAVQAVKYYPAGATTNSASGVTRIDRTFHVLEAMEKHGVVLSVHGEVTDGDVDIFDRERVFIDRVLPQVTSRFPALRIVLEHVTTEHGVQFVHACGTNVAATLTPQHLLYSRNAMLVGGVRPHFYCLPILKRERHRRALVDAATSGSAKFFLGTDSAPHARHTKEHACGCAGCYTAHAALELYAEVFETHGALSKLDDFASGFGADFYGVPRNDGTIALVRESWTVPERYAYGDDTLVPLRAGESLRWKLVPL